MPKGNWFLGRTMVGGSVQFQTLPLRAWAGLSKGGRGGVNFFRVLGAFLKSLFQSD